MEYGFLPDSSSHRLRSQARPIPKQPQAVSKIVVSETGYGFLPDSSSHRLRSQARPVSKQPQAVPKVVESGIEYGFLPDSSSHRLRSHIYTVKIKGKINGNYKDYKKHAYLGMAGIVIFNYFRYFIHK
ncbi:MAG: hypothetical protein LBB43_01175, partial [Spirochaetaceae bacterium]|nr:hypothetical protein [Spirochaetaceae bacterium]